MTVPVPLRTEPPAGDLPAAERERLRALDAIGLARAVEAPTFDGLVETMRRVLRVPVATLAVAETHRLTMKGGHGIPSTCSIDREGTFCDRVVATGRRLVVPDTLAHPSFRTSSWVIGPDGHFRSYIGLPLRTSGGQVVGTLCSFDLVPREPPPVRMLAALESLADAAVSALELGASEVLLRQKRKVLSDRTELLATVLDNVGEGVTAFDADLRLACWNRKALAMLDFPPELARDDLPLLAAARVMAERGLYGEGDPEELAQARVAQAGRTGPFLYERVLRNGRTVRLRGTPLEGGGFLTTYADLTDERRRAEDLAYETRYQLWQGYVGMIANEAADVETALRRYIAFSCDDLAYDLAHVSRRTGDSLVSTGILHVRPGFAECPTDPGELITRITTPSRLAVRALDEPITTFIEDGDLDLGDLGALCGEAAAQLGGGYSCSIAILDEVYVLEFYGPYAITPKPSHLSLIAHLQAQLACVGERERIERLKTEFVSTVTHELKTPLTSIRGILDLLGSGTMGSFPAEVDRMIAIADQDARRLGQLVEDILTIHRLDHDLPGLDLSAHSVPPLVARTVDRFGAGVPITLRHEGADLAVVTDAACFDQILANLLSNAVKFSPPDAPIGVSVVDRGAWIRTSIADRGPGIPETFRPYIFDRFAQADGSDTRRIAGTGLGLAIAKRLADKLGGRLDYETRPGQGTTFHLDLPTARPAAPAAEAA